MTHNFRPSTGIQLSTNSILTSPACPLTHLHMIIHGFAFWKFAKPVYERHLQVCPTLRKPGFVTFTRTLKATPPNSIKTYDSRFMTKLLN